MRKNEFRINNNNKSNNNLLNEYRYNRLTQFKFELHLKLNIKII